MLLDGNQDKLGKRFPTSENGQQAHFINSFSALRKSLFGLVEPLFTV